MKNSIYGLIISTGLVVLIMACTANDPITSPIPTPISTTTTSNQPTVIAGVQSAEFNPSITAGEAVTVLRKCYESRIIALSKEYPENWTEDIQKWYRRGFSYSATFERYAEFKKDTVTIGEERWKVKGPGIENTPRNQHKMAVGTWRVVAGNDIPLPLDGYASRAAEIVKTDKC